MIFDHDIWIKTCILIVYHALSVFFGNSRPFIVLVFYPQEFPLQRWRVQFFPWGFDVVCPWFKDTWVYIITQWSCQGYSRVFSVLALQRKFLWVKDEHDKWSTVSKKYWQGMVYNQDTGLDSDVMIKDHTKLDTPTCIKAYCTREKNMRPHII